MFYSLTQPIKGENEADRLSFDFGLDCLINALTRFDPKIAAFLFTSLMTGINGIFSAPKSFRQCHSTIEEVGVVLSKQLMWFSAHTAIHTPAHLYPPPTNGLGINPRLLFSIYRHLSTPHFTHSGSWHSNCLHSLSNPTTVSASLR